MSAGSTIADASPLPLRRAAVFNGVASFIGILVAGYVYLEFPHPAAIQHSAKSMWFESVVTYIFFFPFLQFALFLVPLFYSIRWAFKHQAVRREAMQKANNPRMQSLDSVLIYQCVCAFMIVFELVAFSMTMYRSINLATGNV
jgi:hypothetical protein